MGGYLMDVSIKITDPNKKVIIPLPDYYDNIIEEISKKYNVEPIVVKKIIKIESNYNPKAQSPVGAIGLMQVMVNHFRGLKIPKNKWFDPKINIETGVKIFRGMYNTIISWKVSHDPKVNFYLTLCAYNSGPTRLKRLIQKHGLKGALRKLPRETRNYLRKYLELSGVKKPIIQLTAEPIAERPEWIEEDLLLAERGIIELKEEIEMEEVRPLPLLPLLILAILGFVTLAKK